MEPKPQAYSDGNVADVDLRSSHAIAASGKFKELHKLEQMQYVHLRLQEPIVDWDTLNVTTTLRHIVRESGRSAGKGLRK